MSGWSRCVERLEILMRSTACSPRTCQLDALQQIGDAQFLAVSELWAATCPVWSTDSSSSCEPRRWDGDAELVDALDHAAGRGASPLRPLPVELDDVGDSASASTPAARTVLRSTTGTVWLQSMTDFGVDDDLDVDFEDETRWLFLEGEGSRHVRDLERFIATVEDDDLADRLTRAMERERGTVQFSCCARTHSRWISRDASLRCRRPARTCTRLARRSRLRSPQTRPPHRPPITGPERAICATWALCLPGRERGRRYCRGHGHHRRRWALRAGQIATPSGTLPTVMGADTAPVAVVITDTVPSLQLVT